MTHLFLEIPRMNIDPQEHVDRLGQIADAMRGLPQAETIDAAAEFIIDITTERDELLTALVGLVEEKQPLGIERESYQTALALVIKYHDGPTDADNLATKEEGK